MTQTCKRSFRLRIFFILILFLKGSVIALGQPSIKPPTVTIGTATGHISTCVGAASASPNIQQVTVSGGNLIGNVNVAAPTNFEVSLSPGSGYSSNINLIQTGGTVNNTIVYVRSAASAPVGNILGQVVVTSPGANSQNALVNGTVNALPTVNQQGNLTYFNGDATAPVIFTGSGNTFTWVNDNPGIGLPASGTGYIPSFKAINTGSTPVVAKIKVIPTLVGHAYISNNSASTISVINTGTDKVTSTINIPTPAGTALSPDFKTLYVTNTANYSVSVINTIDNSLKATITVGTGPGAAAISPDGKILYVTNTNSNTVTVINAATYAVITTITVGQQPYSIAVKPDGTQIYIANFNTNDVTVISTATNSIIGDIAVETAPVATCISPDGSLLYVANTGSNDISVINTSTNKITSTIPTGTSPFGMTISHDGSTLYVANRDDQTMSVINLATKQTTTIAVGINPQGVALTPDGNKLYVSNTLSNNVTVINTATNAVITTVGVGEFPDILGDAVTPGNNCAGNEMDFTITVNSAASITAETTTGIISGCLGSASASPDIQQFIVSGNDLSAGITATAPPNFEVSLKPGSGYAGSVTISPTGGVINNTVVYVRSAASAPAGSIKGDVLLTTPGGVNQTVAVTGTVNVLPAVTQPGNASYANGDVTIPVNFTGTGNAYTWTNDQPGIGLPATGTGDIPSFTAVNNGSSPVTANITVIPANIAYAYIADYNSNDVSVVNTRTNQVVNVIPVGEHPYALSVSPDGKHVYVTNFTSNTVSVISTATNTVTATINTGEGPWGIVVSPDNTRIYVVNSNSSQLEAIDAATNSVLYAAPVGSSSVGIAISPDGKLVYVADGKGYVFVVNTVSPSLSATINTGGSAWGIAVSPDGKFVYVANSGTNKCNVISTADNSIVANVNTGNSSQGVCVSPDNKFVYVTNFYANTVTVIDTRTLAAVNIPSYGENPSSVSFSPDGSYFYVVNTNTNSATIFDYLTSAKIGTVKLADNTNPFSLGNLFAPGSGCSGEAMKFTIIVNQTPLKPAVITFPPFTAKITCDADFAAGATSTNTNTDAPITYTSSNPAVATVSAQGIIHILTSGTTTITASQAADANFDAGQPQQQLLTVNAIPQPTISILPASASGCEGTLFSFTASITNGGINPVYQWQVNGKAAGANSPAFASSSLTTGDKVSCSLTVSTSCNTIPAASNTSTVSVNPPVAPVVTITPAVSAPVCSGEPITLAATINTGGGNSPDYQWQVNNIDAGTNSATFVSSTLNNGDRVTCLVSNTGSCTLPATSQPYTANISPLPVVSFGQNVSINQGSSIQLQPITSGNIATYRWTPATGLSDPASPQPVASPLQTTDYTLQVISDGGCPAEATITVNVINAVLNIPNAFTPNNDGKNDIWNIKYLDSYKNCTVNIYTRYGQNVFSSIGYGEAWNGSFKGASLPVGTYYYVIDLKNGHEPLSGYVAIIR